MTRGVRLTSQYALIAGTAAPVTVETMTNDMNAVPTPGGDAAPMIDAERMTALLVEAFNTSALGNLKAWSLGSWRRSETIAALQAQLRWMAPLAASDTLGLWFALRLASATGSAMAIASRVDDDDADTREDKSMISDGADVLSMQIVETDRVWMTLDGAGRRRWRERLVERIDAVSTVVGGSPADATVELASCTAVAAAVVIRAATSGLDSRSLDVRRTLVPVCPACGTANQLTQSTAGWASVRGVDLEFEVATIGESVAAERGEVMCRECFGEFSENEVVRASIVFEAAAASR